MKTCLVVALSLAMLPLRTIAETGKTGSAASDTAAMSPAQLKKYYSRTVADYVKDQIKKAGAFIVHDDVMSKDWRLRMLKVHTERIWDQGNGHFFACADLREMSGPKTKLDLDFFVRRQGGQWIMDKVVVHKVSGQARYTYVEENGKWFSEDLKTKIRTPVE